MCVEIDSQACTHESWSHLAAHQLHPGALMTLCGVCPLAVPQDKLGEAWDTQHWAEEFPNKIPKQNNGCDCGVFMLMLCNRLGLGSFAGIDFCQRSMSNLRCGIAFDLLNGKVAATASPGCLVQQG